MSQKDQTPRRALKFVFQPPADPSSALAACAPAGDMTFLFSVLMAGDEIGRCLYRLQPDHVQARLCLAPALAAGHDVATSILKILVLEAEQTGGADELRLELPEHAAFPEAAARLGFRTDGRFAVRPLDRAKGRLVSATKAAIRSRLAQASLVGRGHVMDIADIDQQQLACLSQEYNEIAWGLTSWAANAAIDEDETAVIRRHAAGRKVLEIGAGSGRLSGFIADLAKETVLTDYTAESCQVLREKFGDNPAVSVAQDDITATTLPGQGFEVVFFLENGLGNLLAPSARRTAMAAICDLVAPGGCAVLGMRELPQSPCEHVMVATQNEHIIGIYHTFSKQEVQDLLPPGYAITEVIDGNERPAGGRAFFVRIERS